MRRRKTLDRVGLPKLHEWWCMLNCFEWPKDFPLDQVATSSPEWGKAFSRVEHEIAFKSVKSHWWEWCERNQ